MSLPIIFHDLRRRIFERPYSAIAVCIYEVHRRWIVELPLVEELAVLVEHLHPAVSAVADVDPSRYRIGGDAVDNVEITRARFLAARIAFLSPGGDELPVLIELHNAVSVVSVRNEHRAVGKPREKRRPIEVRSVRAGLAHRSDGLNKLFAVVCELEERLIVVIHNPDMLFRIVR